MSIIFFGILNTNFNYILALKEMRVDAPTTVLKNPKDSNSAIMKKRRNNAGAVGSVPSTITEQMSTE